MLPSHMGARSVATFLFSSPRRMVSRPLTCVKCIITNESAVSVVPPGLVGFLPENFTFASEDFDLDWENGGGLIGVAVVTDNDQLGQALLNVAGPGSWFVSGNRYTFVLDQG